MDWFGLGSSDGVVGLGRSVGRSVGLSFGWKVGWLVGLSYLGGLL
jgi:hypothetical protein